MAVADAKIHDIHTITTITQPVGTQSPDTASEDLISVPKSSHGAQEGQNLSAGPTWGCWLLVLHVHFLLVLAEIRTQLDCWMLFHSALAVPPASLSHKDRRPAAGLSSWLMQWKSDCRGVTVIMCELCIEPLLASKLGMCMINTMLLKERQKN